MTLMFSKLFGSSRFIARHCHSFALPTLMLAGAICLSTGGSALADFESAVAAYETGAYQDARTEFEALAAVGDERAKPYLERIRQRLNGEQPTDRSFTSKIGETLTSVFGGADRPSDERQSEGSTIDSGSFVVGPSKANAAEDRLADWEPWNPFEQSTRTAAPPQAPKSDVFTPARRSVLSVIFHLPGDATVIGMQYVANLLSADKLSRELQVLSRHSDRIALSILAGFWWLAIVRGLIGLTAIILRFMKTATTMSEQKRYG